MVAKLDHKGAAGSENLACEESFGELTGDCLWRLNILTARNVVGVLQRLKAERIRRDGRLLRDHSTWISGKPSTGGRVPVIDNRKGETG